MGTRDNNGQVLLTIEEAAQFLNVSKATVYRLVRKGVVEKVKLEGHRAWRVSIESLETYDTANSLTLPELATRLVRVERKLDLVLSRGQAVAPTDTADFQQISQELRRRHPELHKHTGFDN